MEEKSKACKVLVGNPEEMRPLGKPSHGGRIILQWVDMDWMHMA
jgi:hypothetical protein